MKYLLLILFSVVFNDCIGQKKDSVVVKGSGHDLIITGGRGGNAQPGTIIFHTSDTNLKTTQSLTTLRRLSKQDTIKVLMLVCDTFPLSKFVQWGDDMPVGNWVTKDGKEYYRNYVWWQYGYEVQTTCGHTLSTHPMGTICPHWILYSHLDQNKKPLPSSIVVWMTKEIK